jgi:uncharacterized protein YxjI
MIDLTRHPEIVVRQQVEVLEVFTGFETANRYVVSTPEGEQLLYAYEESGWLSRQFLKTHRPLTLQVIDNERQTLLSASRSFFWFLSHLHVRDGVGRPVGSLRRQFAFLKRRFLLEDASGNPIAEVQGKLFRPNTFMFYVHGSEVARVTKQWGGIMREAFSDADTFKVQQDPGLDQDLSLLVLATAFAVDLDFFESGGGGPSLSLGG